MSLILALDVGTKRVGTALADRELRIPTPHQTFDRAKGAAESKILQLLSEKGITEVVVGLPLNDDGGLNDQCSDVQNFCRRLEKRASVTIHFVDEYMSSMEAEDELRRMGKDLRTARTSGLIDAVAASLILRSYFELEANGRELKAAGRLKKDL